MLNQTKRLRPILVKSALSCAIAALIAVGAAWALTPSPERVIQMALGSDRILLAANGQLLQTLRTDFKKRRLGWYKINNFSKNIQSAVLAAEDQRFYYHPGFDPFGMGRAFLANVRGRPVQGASTITMQLSDLIQEDVLLRNRPIQKGSLLHKLVQVTRAVLIEIRWSKQQILEAYLNLIHLRGEFQGVPALSYAYLNRHPLALDLDQSYVIAAMVSSPNLGSAPLAHKACALMEKRLFALASERGDKATACKGIEEAAASFFSHPPAMPASPGFAPHLARRLFNEHPDASVITSTIDMELQRKVIAIMEKNLFRLRADNVRDNAVIVLDNKTGQVLAYVGTVASSDSPHVDGVQAYRQAGSTLKPFIYAKALETKTLTAASILLDDPTAISWGGDVYRPSNYDLHFNGPVSVREALASSLNVPAVKTVTIIGLRQTYQVLQSIMLTHLKDPDFYGVSMALGAVEVKLEELANAYRMLANLGKWSPIQLTKDEPILASQTKQVFSPGATYIIGSILSDPNARSIGFGWENPLETPFWTAVKTGTSKDYRDNWCMGFSDKYTVGVWAGNFNAEAMHKVSGVSGVGPTWYEIMNVLHNQERSEPPKIPAGIVAKNIRHQWASHSHTEYFLEGTAPEQEVIEPSLEKRIQFVFPADGSILVKDPHLDQNHIALFIRFKGSIPNNSQLLWDGKPLGVAASPFKIDQPESGDHELAIATSDGRHLAQVHFRIKGAQ